MLPQLTWGDPSRFPPNPPLRVARDNAGRSARRSAYAIVGRNADEGGDPSRFPPSPPLRVARDNAGRSARRSAYAIVGRNADEGGWGEAGRVPPSENPGYAVRESACTTCATMASSVPERSMAGGSGGGAVLMAAPVRTRTMRSAALTAPRPFSSGSAATGAAASGAGPTPSSRASKTLALG